MFFKVSFSISFMQIIGYVLIIIAFARLLAELMERIGYPGFLGEIAAGMLLSAILTGMPRSDMTLLAEFGLFFLMISAGLEITPEELHYGGKKTLPIYIVTYTLMLVLTLPFTGWKVSSGNVISAAILSTASAPIVIRLERFFGRDFLHMALSYAVISEVAGLTVVYLAVKVRGSPGYMPIVIGILKDAAFIGSVLYINHLIEIKHKVWITMTLRRLKSDEAVFGIFMVFATLMAFISEELGMHFSIGGFLAGLIMHSDLVGTKQYERLRTITSGITFGIFAPIFFAWRGLNFETELSTSVLEFFALTYFFRLAISSVMVKKQCLRRSILRGAGISSFGVLGLLIGEIGYTSGALSEHMYAMASLACVLGMFTSATIGHLLARIGSEE